jgi:hypothetical protein
MEINSMAKILRDQRIATLGGYGTKRTQVIKNPKQYNRKVKHKNKKA